MHVFYTINPIDTGAFRAFYLIADLKDKSLNFATDTTFKRRLTPAQFFQKNDQPIAVVNGTFFSFETNENLNVVIKDGKLVSYTAPVKGKGKDSVNMYYAFKSAIGISKRRRADVAWIYSDSSKKYAKASQISVKAVTPPIICCDLTASRIRKIQKKDRQSYNKTFSKWKMETAIGGGPSLVQNGEIKVTNEEANVCR